MHVPRSARGVGAGETLEAAREARRAWWSSTSRCRRSSRSSRRSPRTAFSPTRCGSPRRHVVARVERAPPRRRDCASAGRSTSTSRRRPRSRGWTRAAACRCTRPPSIRPRRRKSSRACSGSGRHQVTVECLRMGGAFGGKEVQANTWAAIAALGAWKTRRPVRVRLTRALDMALTGKRHPYLARYRAGFSRDGRIRGAGARALLGRRLEPRSLRADHVAIAVSLRQRLPPAGGRGDRPRLPHAQDVADGVSRLRRTAGDARHRRDPLARRRAARRSRPTSFASATSIATATRRTTAQPVEDAGRLAIIWERLKATSASTRRRAEIAHFNAAHPHVKRGLAITPVKFGISFTATFFNQAGALVLIYRDGTVQVNHGGTEMGQGLFTKIQQIAADALGVTADQVRVMPTRTDKVPNTSATAASAGTDLNGAAVVDACAQIRERLADGRGAACSRCDAGRSSSTAAWCRAAGGRCRSRRSARPRIAQRVPLFAQGFYRTPDIHFDPATGRGRPFHYFAYGAAVSEVEVDGFTGAYRLRRIDILQDVGDSISPIDRSRPGRGRLHSGRGLADDRGAAVGRARAAWRPAAHPPTSCRPGPKCRTSSRSSSSSGRPQPGCRDGQQGRRRAAADARDLGARSDSRRRRGLRAHRVAQPPDVTFASPATPERVFFAVERRPRAIDASEASSEPPGSCAHQGAVLSHAAQPVRRCRARSSCHEDGGLLVQHGRIVASGDYRDVRAEAPADAACLDWRGGFVLPDSSTRTCTIPQLRIIGGLGRTLLDWLEHVALPEEARMADVAYAAEHGAGVRRMRCSSHGTTTALVFGAHFGPATAALFEAAADAGLRMVSGLVVSDRGSGPSCIRRPTRRVSRQHRSHPPLSRPRAAALRGDAALRALGVGGDARGLPDAGRRARRPARADAHQRKAGRDRGGAAAVSVGEGLPGGVRALRLERRPPVMAHNVHAVRRRARTPGVAADGGRALPVQQRRARQRHLSAAASPGRRRAVCARHRRRRRHRLRHAQGRPAGVPDAARRPRKAMALDAGAPAVPRDAGRRRGAGTRRRDRRPSPGQGRRLRLPASRRRTGPLAAVLERATEPRAMCWRRSSRSPVPRASQRCSVQGDVVYRREVDPRRGGRMTLAELNASDRAALRRRARRDLRGLAVGRRAGLGTPAVRVRGAAARVDGGRGGERGPATSSSPCCARIPISGTRARMSDASDGEQAGAGLTRMPRRTSSNGSGS